jgi:hypothetical protein
MEEADPTEAVAAQADRPAAAMVVEEIMEAAVVTVVEVIMAEAEIMVAEVPTAEAADAVVAAATITISHIFPRRRC